MTSAIDVIVIGAGQSGLAAARALQARGNGGRDLHYWLKTTGFDLLPPQWLRHYLGDRWVVDTGKYQHAVATGQLDRRPMFTAFDRDHIIWPDGTQEKADTVLFATGYRPDLDYLSPLGALDDGMPLHAGGISTTHPGLVYVGLEFQRSFSSNTLRGVHRDAEHVTARLSAHVRNAPAAVGVRQINYARHCKLILHWHCGPGRRPAGGALGRAAAAVLLAITSSYAPVSAAVAAAFLASAIMLIRQPELSHDRSRR